LLRLDFNPIWTAGNALANGIAIYLFVLSTKGRGTPNAKHAMYVFAGFSCCTVVAIFIQRIRSERKQRIAESLELLRWAFVDLQEVAADSNATSGHIRDVCTGVVNKLANALTRISRKNCSACIKLVVNDPSLLDHADIDPIARTLCRDDSSRDREQKIFAAKHWIKKNTDFTVLFDQLQLGTPAPDNFFCNNLPKIRDYMNTSIPEGHVQRHSKLLPLDWYYRRKDWVLPYRSTVVFRIAKLVEDKGRQSLSIVGFLCVDANSTGTFSKNEVSLIRSIADCLYRPIVRYSKLQTTKQTKINRPENTMEEKQ
jgi:hypothetical protein